MAYGVGRGAIWKFCPDGKYRHFLNNIIESLRVEECYFDPNFPDQNLGQSCKDMAKFYFNPLTRKVKGLIVYL